MGTYKGLQIPAPKVVVLVVGIRLNNVNEAMEFLLRFFKWRFRFLDEARDLRVILASVGLEVREREGKTFGRRNGVNAGKCRVEEFYYAGSIQCTARKNLGEKGHAHGAYPAS
jgi:hypothetical protein